MMRYVSTRGRAVARSFSEILFSGTAEDGGLYMPDHWPRFSINEIGELKQKPFAHAAYKVLREFDDDFSYIKLQQLCEQAYTAFHHSDICPLVKISERQYILELHHGPTLAFKDIAMQLLAKLIETRLQERRQRATMICATSGDTGAAAVKAFENAPNIDVVVLFPEGRISAVQRRQMTTSNASNIFPIAIKGTFDHAQFIVKELFADKNFSHQFSLTSVNSINWARIVAQITYYFTAALQADLPENLSFCVPTGNFGDIFAGFAAKKLGLPIKRLVIATNSNDILLRALETGKYAIENVISTSSPSMDIQLSSNFERLLFEATERNSPQIAQMMQDLSGRGHFEIPANVLERIRQDFSAASAGEYEVKNKIDDFYKKTKMLVDPHTAVALVAADKVRHQNETMIVLSTAHPAKFPDAVKSAANITPELPVQLQAIMHKEEQYSELPADAKIIKTELEKYLQKNYST